MCSRGWYLGILRSLGGDRLPGSVKHSTTPAALPRTPDPYVIIPNTYLPTKGTEARQAALPIGMSIGTMPSCSGELASPVCSTCSPVCSTRTQAPKFAPIGQAPTILPDEINKLSVIMAHISFSPSS